LFTSETLLHRLVTACDFILTPIQNTNPHELYIWYHIILYYGQRHPSLFRSHRRWYKLLPTLGEVVGLDCEEVRVDIAGTVRV